MSRGEENDQPITGDDHFAVVISGDGSAAIDGVPVRMAAGQEPDAAILDALHTLARTRATTVTATISDPSAAYVAHIEVAPDGSSRLLEQRETPVGVVDVAVADDDEDDEAEDEADEREAVVLEKTAPGRAASFEDDEDDEDDEGNEGNEEDFDEASYTLPEPPPPPPPVSARTGDVDPDDDEEDEYEYENKDEYEDKESDGDEESDEDDDRDPPPPPSLNRTPAPAPTPAPPPPLVRRLDRRNGSSRQSDDEYAPAGLLQRPLVVAPAALAVAGIVVVSLVVLGSSDSGGDSQQASSNSSTRLTESPTKEPPAPTYSVSISPPSESPSPSLSPSPSPSSSAKAKSVGANTSPEPPSEVTTVTETPPRSVETVTQKPAADTAGSAVRRLAESDPGGRHICYRAYVSGQGWQKPVCDGTLAGTTGQDKAIRALNIAVYGANGSAANAFQHNPDSTNGEGKWAPNWTAVTGDGKDIYIGKTSGPYMTGFAINVGSGKICPSAKVRGYDWGSQGCADPRPAYIFGGTLENTRFLEAVKFTV